MAKVRFEVLFLALVGFLFVMPVLGLIAPEIGAAAAAGIQAGVFVVMLLAAALSVSHSSRAVRLGLILAVPTAILRVIDVASSVDSFRIPSLLFAMAFLGFVIAALFQLLFRPARVSRDMIFAALCIYLLIGVLWAIAYSLLDHLDPAFFHGLREAAAPSAGPAQDLGASLYFSFVTLSTLGYGDIAPAAPLSRMVATLEAIIGQIYLAVLVARLVGQYVSDSMTQPVSR